MKLDKNKKIAIGVGILGILAFILYKKGVFGQKELEVGQDETPTDDKEIVYDPNAQLKSSMPPSVPIINLTASSETPQFVNIPPQFGNQTAVVNRLPTGAFQTFN
jgi:hypothetical protein